MRGPSGVKPAIIACLVALPLSACSDPAQPGTLPSRSPTTAVSSPTPSASPSPKRQVEAAVRTYYAELTRAAQTNNTSRLKHLLDRNCPCYRAVKVIDKGATAGERAPEATWTLRSVKVHDLFRGSAGAEVQYDVTAYDVLDSSGRVLTHIAAQRSHLDLSLVRKGEGWVVANVFDLQG